ncbi:nucleotide exchange factor GrpE [Mycoplasma sp. NEAQ87857]|uniref:nucleotide exchange factor GrpE n=1 Tax=Mycoplasma sp. NEAQ87857 TaxID=2683967 RepID=UPI0013198CEF|nr:nucleotide exchange factor GrpE [Mycoplasma sp. NEAQ87857]QGZ97739.1 nucleotide exchange factor GrpE [Mycoplasma sp. NEAQ87857]
MTVSNIKKYLKQDIKEHYGHKLEKYDLLQGDFELIVDSEINEEYTLHKVITLGENQYLPNFDSHFFNKTIKHQIEIKFEFPKSYEIKEFRSKHATLIIKNVQVAKHNDQINALKVEIKELNTQAELAQYAFKTKMSELQLKANNEIQKVKDEQKEKLEKEKEEIKKFAASKLFESLMNPLSNFALATEFGKNSTNSEVKNYCLGFEIVIKQFRDIFEQNGANFINPIIGEEFNPEKEQVIDFVNDEQLENNVITKVVKEGLELNARVLIPASVIVNKK